MKERRIQNIDVSRLRKGGIGNVRVPGRGLKLFCLRELPHDAPFHLWGGKRISEKWDARSETLMLALDGPVGLEDEIFIDLGAKPIREVKVNGKQGQFFVDPAQRVVHGRVAFGSNPVRIEASCSFSSEGVLPERPTAPLGLPAR